MAVLKARVTTHTPCLPGRRPRSRCWRSPCRSTRCRKSASSSKRRQRQTFVFQQVGYFGLGPARMLCVIIYISIMIFLPSRCPPGEVRVGLLHAVLTPLRRSVVATGVHQHVKMAATAGFASIHRAHLLHYSAEDNTYRHPNDLTTPDFHFGLPK